MYVADIVNNDRTTTVLCLYDPANETMSPHLVFFPAKLGVCLVCELMPRPFSSSPFLPISPFCYSAQYSYVAREPFKGASVSLFSHIFSQIKVLLILCFDCGTLSEIFGELALALLAFQVLF